MQTGNNFFNALKAQKKIHPPISCEIHVKSTPKTTPTQNTQNPKT